MPKKILIHSIVFSPDGVSTAYLYNDIALGMSKAGYEVVVLTTTPHYNVVPSELEKQPLRKRILGLFYESNFKGIKVLHVPQKKYSSTVLRMFGFVYWHILSFFLGISESRVRAILSPSPPLTIGLINIVIGWIKGAKVVYNVQEIYPDLLIEQGGLRNGALIKLLKSLESFIYNKSDAVTTIDEIFYNTISPRFNNPGKLKIIPNFVDTALYRPLEKDTLNLDVRFFPNDGRLKVMYAGNIGHAQDWEPLLEVATKLVLQPIDFIIIGEGVMKSYVQEQVLIRGLSNVSILPYQPRDSMPGLIAYADLHFIFMSKEVEGHGFPSKVYTIMASSKPLLVISGKDTPIHVFLNPIKCAELITSRDLDQKVNEVSSFLLKSSRQELLAMGKRGYNIIQDSYSSTAVVQKYVSLFDNLLK